MVIRHNDDDQNYQGTHQKNFFTPGVIWSILSRNSTHPKTFAGPDRQVAHLNPILHPHNSSFKEYENGGHFSGLVISTQAVIIQQEFRLPIQS